MAQNINPTFVKTPNWGATQITTGTGSSGLVTVYTGGANGSMIVGLMAVSVGTTNSFDLQWGVSSGGAFILHGTAAVLAGAGSTDSIATVNLMSASNVPLPINSDGNPFLFLPSASYTLQVKTPALSSAWASGAQIQVVAPSIGDF